MASLGLLGVERRHDAQHGGFVVGVALGEAFRDVGGDGMDLTTGDRPGEPRRLGQRHRLELAGQDHRRSRLAPATGRRCAPRTAPSTTPWSVDTASIRRRPATAPSSSPTAVLAAAQHRARSLRRRRSHRGARRHRSRSVTVALEHAVIVQVFDSATTEMLARTNGKYPVRRCGHCSSSRQSMSGLRGSLCARRSS